MTDQIVEIVEGAQAGRQVAVNGAIDIGRDPAAGIVLDDEQVSRLHVRLQPVGGGVQVDDLGSTNGTYVNDQPLVGPYTLQPGDRVRVGLTVLELRTQAQVAAQPSAVRPAPLAPTLDPGVLQPARPAELAPVGPVAPNVSGFLAEESEPAFVPRTVRDALGDGSGGPAAVSSGRVGDVARLVDSRVKRETKLIAFTVVAVAAILLVVFLGVT